MGFIFIKRGFIINRRALKSTFDLYEKCSKQSNYRVTGAIVNSVRAICDPLRSAANGVNVFTVGDRQSSALYPPFLPLAIAEGSLPENFSGKLILSVLPCSSAPHTHNEQ